MPPDRRRNTALLGERAAANHLTRNGCRVLERNYRKREGELDVIALERNTLVFCEVKTLLLHSNGDAALVHPFESIRPAKRRQVRRIARAWLAERREADRLPRYRAIRFDAIGVTLSPQGKPLAVEHLRNAF